MNRFSCFLLALVLPLALAGAIQTPQKKTSKKTGVKSGAKSGAKPVARTAPHGKVPTRTVNGKVNGKMVKGKKGGKALHSAPVQRSQAAPTPDRYREIQQALAAKGYLKTDPTGVWDSDTQEAMRRFQADQKLEETGKINALSLISLGLGPQH